VLVRQCGFLSFHLHLPSLKKIKKKKIGQQSKQQPWALRLFRFFLFLFSGEEYIIIIIITQAGRGQDGLMMVVDCGWLGKGKGR